MFRQTLMIAAGAAALAATPASAGVTLSAVNGTEVYAGPAATVDLLNLGALSISGGFIGTGSTSSHAQPWGTVGNYWAVGPSDGSPGTLNLSSIAAIGAISFVWGSIDSYNTLEVLDRVGGVLASYTGAHAAVSPSGNQTSPFTNRVATLSFSGADQTNIGGLRLSSSSNAFEVANFSITAVPEPAAWAMLLIGFGFVGAFMRRQNRQQRVRMTYA